MNKKQQLLNLLAEQLLLHNEFPEVRVICSKLSITIDEYVEILLQCSSEELKSVFTILTPRVVMNIFQQTSESIPAQKLWSELFLKSTGASNMTEQNSITVQFLDEPKKVQNSSPSALKEVLKLQQSP